VTLGAFNKDEALKAAALSDLSSGGHRGWATDATDEERDACVTTFGLTRSFVNLLSMASRAPYMDGSSAYLKTVLAGVEPGANLDRGVRGWMIAVWKDPRYGAATRIEGSGILAPAREVIGLVERSLVEEVARNAWRPSRNALLAALKEADPIMAGYGRVVAAMAWDLNAMPGVGADVWLAWERAIEGEVGHEGGWPPAQQEEVLELYRGAMREANAAVSALEEVPQSERTAREAAVQAELDRRLASSSLGERWKNLMAFWQGGGIERLQTWRSHGLETLREAFQAGGGITR